MLTIIGLFWQLLCQISPAINKKQRRRFTTHYNKLQIIVLSSLRCQPTQQQLLALRQHHRITAATSAPFASPTTPPRSPVCAQTSQPVLFRLRHLLVAMPSRRRYHRRMSPATACSDAINASYRPHLPSHHDPHCRSLLSPCYPLLPLLPLPLSLNHAAYASVSSL
jgi:hypothetical protein